MISPVDYFRTALFLIMLSILVSCASQNNLNKQLIVNYQAAKALNPDINGIPSPVVVTIYQLSSALNFKNSNFFYLQENPTQQLSSSLVDSNEIEIRPDQKITEKLSLWSKTHYIGITAAYRNINNSQWRIILPINNTEDKPKNLTIFIGSLDLNATLDGKTISKK